MLLRAVGCLESVVNITGTQNKNDEVKLTPTVRRFSAGEPTMASQALAAANRLDQATVVPAP